jgi:aspartate/methionine/tyrosine aminotransferase
MSIQLLGGIVEEIRLPADLPLARAIGAGGLDAVPPGGLLVVVNPSNPTGRRFDPPEVQRLVEWAAERGTRLVVDETYLEFHPPHETPSTALAVEEWWRSSVVVGTFSKSLAITGQRVGYLCADHDLVREVLKVQDTAAVCAPHPGQRAVLAALGWDGCDAWLEARRWETHERVAAFADEMGRRPGPFAIETAGAFFAWIRHASGPAAGAAGDWQIADRLARQRRVVALPGAPFGPNERDRLRVSVGNADPAALREAARRMQAFTME